jgi:hypothetical protein
MTAKDAEKLLSKTEKVCTRLLVDERKGVLTRDGWIPRLMLAGAISISAAGCTVNTGEASVPALAPYTANPEQIETLGKVAVPQKQNPPKTEPKFLVGDVAVPQKPTQPQATMGTPVAPQKLMGKPAKHTVKPVKNIINSKPPKKGKRRKR